MNKKILSCALVAAMLASSVGAMGVSAANDDSFTNYYTNVRNSQKELVAAVNDGIAKGEIATVPFVDDLENGKADPAKIYLENYKPASDTKGVSFDDVLEAVADAEGDETTSADFKAAVKALGSYFGLEVDSSTGKFKTTTDSGKQELNYESESNRKVSSTRSDAMDALEDNMKDIKDNFDATFYDAAELDVYGIFHAKDDKDTTVGKVNDLIYEVNRADFTTPTTRFLYLNYEYERFFGEDGLLSTTTSWEEKYETLLEDAEALTADDFTAANWAQVEYKIKLAALEAEKGTAAGYRAAYTALQEVFKIETVKPDYAALEDAVEGLFGKDGKPETGYYKGVNPTGKDVYTYLKEDYENGKGEVSDEWYEFAGTPADAKDYVEGAYRRAYAVYDACQKSSTRKYVAQSTVDKVLGELNDALLALDPNYETSNWVVVMLEEALDAANAVVETDYRTTSTYWKNFVKDKEYIEKLLEQSNVKESVAKDAVVKLLGSDMDASKGTDGSLAKLSNCKLSIPTATKNALKDAMDEAKDLLKDKTGKTSAQIVALQTAYDDASVLSTSKNTISEYENATTELNNAITNYKHPQGWYKGTDGLWYYGKEDKNATGWLNVNGVWYYLDATTGAMKTGWQQINGTWYYLNASGAMQTGWLNLNGTYYYLESWGGMATGWKNVNGSWYYLQPSGAMLANGWYWINGKCYYFYNWGGMAANTTIGGYTVDASGAWVK